MILGERLWINWKDDSNSSPIIEEIKKKERDATEKLKAQLEKGKKEHPAAPVIVYAPPEPPSFQPAQRPSKPMRDGKVIEAGH